MVCTIEEMAVTWINRAELNELLGEDVAKSLLGMMYRNLNETHNKQSLATYVINGTTKQRVAFTKAWRITSVLKLLKADMQKGKACLWRENKDYIEHKLRLVR